jgi:mono/diheme cytochrome c family protein
MSKSLKGAIVFGALCLIAAPASAGKFGLGREATPAEVAAWDIDVRPDGQGLPAGQGNVAQGEKIFLEKCAACHGDFGEGSGRWPVLAGGQSTLKGEHPVKTIGSYWPYLSTAFDYIRRAMPFGDSQSLTADETYAIIAYLLNMNDLVPQDFVLSDKNFTSVRLPNEKNFVVGRRPQDEIKRASDPCMRDCKANVKITKRARVIDVTPTEGEHSAPKTN